MNPEDRKMGRIYIPDERDNLYLASSILPPRANLDKKYWFSDGHWGDQGGTPHCVAYAWMHWLNDGPQVYSLFKSRRPGIDTSELYCEAQKLDAWDGDCDNPQYEGTSVRAGAKVLKNMGLIKEYRWVNNIEDLVTTILTVGPVVVGTNWYSEMSFPTNNILKPEGYNVGGHAYLINGIDKDLLRVKNSWGRYWGEEGHAYISLDDFNILLSQWGEICLAIR